MSHKRRNQGSGKPIDRLLLTRRQAVVASASATLLAVIGCGEDAASSGAPAAGTGSAAGSGGQLGAAGAQATAATGGSQAGVGGQTPSSVDPSTCTADALCTDGGTAVQPTMPEFPSVERETDPHLWQMVCPYVRATADASHGTRINLYNPSKNAQRVVMQAFLANGQCVLHTEIAAAFAGQTSQHLELADIFRANGLPLPFEGSLYVGATPLQAGDLTFMGLQGISFDWWGPSHLASVHSMRDFGNTNHDAIWSDMVFPKISVGPRYESKIAILNVTGDGSQAGLKGAPEVIIRDDSGTELFHDTIAQLEPFQSVMLSVRDLLGGAELRSGAIQVIHPELSLVAYGYLVDRESGGIVGADHFFDRHFVVTLRPEELFN
jgi:hypothetical protein